MRTRECCVRGSTFRSRTTARWSIVFDTLGITYSSEPENYQLENDYFCPDFYLPGEKAFVHTTSFYSSEVGTSCERLALVSGLKVLYITGSPGIGKYKIALFDTWQKDSNEQGYRALGDFVFAEDRKVSRCLWLIDEGGSCVSLTLSADPKHGEKYPMQETDWIRGAFEKASNYRFSD